MARSVGLTQGNKPQEQDGGVRSRGLGRGSSWTGASGAGTGLCIVWEQGDWARRLGQEEQVIGLGDLVMGSKGTGPGAGGPGQEQGDLARGSRWT